MTIPGWEEWCLERIQEAREYAEMRGDINIQTGVFHRLSANILDLQERFPTLPLDVALHDLAALAAVADHNDGKK